MQLVHELLLRCCCCLHKLIFIFIELSHVHDIRELVE